MLDLKLNHVSKKMAPGYKPLYIGLLCMCVYPHLLTWSMGVPLFGWINNTSGEPDINLFHLHRRQPKKTEKQLSLILLPGGNAELADHYLFVCYSHGIYERERDPHMKTSITLEGPMRIKESQTTNMCVKKE